MADIDINELVFNKKDCVVKTPRVDGSDGLTRTPKWGVQAGNSINGVMGAAIEDDLKLITVTHVPTGITVSEHRFHPKRNKDLCYQRLETLVNIRIKEMQEYVRQQEGKV